MRGITLWHEERRDVTERIACIGRKTQERWSHAITFSTQVSREDARSVTTAISTNEEIKSTDGTTMTIGLKGENGEDQT